MKARHVILCLTLFLLGTGLQAQDVANPRIVDIPQVFSPNASELGKYGRIPVSYFNGLPNISIPLTELRARNYTLPIYLTYHASGNKPDQHPGWVGLGWTLHAGGCINRIVNGLKDEMTTTEYLGIHQDDGMVYSPPSDPGYYHHATSVQETNWDDEQNWYDANNEIVMMDRDPDEFQICLDDIQASFYFTSGGAIRIVSKSDADFTVEAHMTPVTPDPVILYPGPDLADGRGRAKRYKFFDRFTITSKDGTRYVFGGDDSAIEYWMPLTRVSYVDQNTGSLLNANTWRCIATACTWLLTRIERPDGEIISFTYEKDGTPVVRRDVHQGGYELASRYGNAIRSFVYDTKDYPSLMPNISFGLIKPSYLSTITCHQSQDHLEFARIPTTELKYPTTRSEFETRTGDYHYDNMITGQRYYSYEQIMAEDYYMQMSGISGPSRDIHLSYTSDSNQRLSLQQVSFHDSKTAQPDYHYSFEYNTEPLPPYGARKSDVWGFYNDIYYGNVQNGQLESVRNQVNPSKAQAEILTAIEYPTGGRTEFTYEGHTYSKKMEPISMTLEETGASVLTGGLRIRELKDYSVAGRPETRTFSYTGNNGISSGILAGSPRLYVQGHTLLYYQFGDPQVLLGADTLGFTSHYHLYSENPLRPLSTTDGNYVTYSQVRETYSDGSYTDYRYSNHDQLLCADTLPGQRYEIADSLLLVTSFNSRELFRGMLLEKKEYDKEAHLVRHEQYFFDRDTTSFIKALSYESEFYGYIKSGAYRKILTGYPFLKRKRVSFYPDTGVVPYSETQEFTYDSHRRLTEASRNVAGTNERETYTYTGDYSEGPYLGMNSLNMIAYPVEHICFRKDTLKNEVVIGAELNTWKLHGSHYVPSEQWTANLGSGVSPASFNAYGVSSKDSRYGSDPELVFTKYDINANPIQSEDRAGLFSTYYWTQDHVHPTAVFRGAKNGTRTQLTVQQSNHWKQSDLNELSSGSVSIPFRCDYTGAVDIELDFIPAYGRTVWWRLDEGTEHQQVWSSPAPGEELEIPFLFSGVLPAGNHYFQITQVQGVYTDAFFEDPYDPEEPLEEPGDNILMPSAPFSQTPSWGTVGVYYPANNTIETQVRSDECLFEDFEDNASSTHEGFHGGKSYNGIKVLDFVPCPDRDYVIDWQERQSDGTWKYRSKTVNDLGSFTAGNSGKTIDHVRVFPVGTTVESYTWDPAGNLTSRTDSRGVTESYRYDGLGRLVGVYDNDEKKTEGYQYNYQNR